MAEDKNKTAEDEGLDLAKYTYFGNLFSRFGLYAKLNKLITDDPNGRSRSLNSFKKYSRENILGYLNNAVRNSEKLIDASVYLYSMSSLYKRLCKYFSSMPTFDYVISPVSLTGEELDKAAKEKYRKAYKKCLEVVESLNVKKNFENILCVAIREGAYFGIEIANKDSYMLYQLPYQYCKVTSWEDGCPLFSVNMNYFSGNNAMLLESMPDFMVKAYNESKSSGKRWIELPSESSICILADETLDYIVPPLCGCFPDLYAIDEYKDLIETKSVIDLYKLITLQIPTNPDTGKPAIDDDIASKYYQMIAAQLPDQIGLAMAPFKYDSVSFNQSGTASANLTAEAERALFGAVGVSPLIFGEQIESSTALKYSVVNDYVFIRPIVKSLEHWVNKKLKLMVGATKFRAVFPDVSIYNREDYVAQLSKLSQYGFPNRGLIAAIAFGYSPSDVYGINLLETEILGYNESFIPPKSANNATASDEVGRPRVADTELSDSGERTRDTDGNAEK